MKRKSNTEVLFETSFDALKNYCKKEQFKGWDPFDGLNSWVVQKTLLGKSRYFRLGWIQFFKRSPVNLRPVFLINKTYNPKGLALFITSYCNLYRLNPTKETLDKIGELSEKLLNLKSKQYNEACWGYNFDWQARAFFQPKHTPNIVTTSFAVEALINAYRITGNTDILRVVKSSSNFVLNRLNKTFDRDQDYTLSYSPLDSTQVYNAGLLGAKTLSLIYAETQDKNLIREARKIVSFVCKKQSPDGSWAYGTLPYHSWIDSFHTGYNLECISIYQKTSGDKSFQKNLEIGMTYYLETFFTEEGIPKYYSDKIFPIDVHSSAQLLATLYKTNSLKNNKQLVDLVLTWTIKNMQSSRGFFYYQRNKLIVNKIPYMRWTQAWMFYAFSYYFLALEK